MRGAIKSFARALYHHRLVRGTLRRAFAARDRKIARAYLERHDIRKLQIGAGHNLHAGWLNTNWFPIRFIQRDYIFLDAGQPMPFPAATFDYVFTEHMIEHVPYLTGQAMLRECFRILKPGGKLRISTPDFAFLIDLMKPGLSPLQQSYIDGARSSLPDGVPTTPATVANNFVRDWGHQFIYDKATLTGCLAAAGFVNITPFEVNQSDDPQLAGIDHADRMPEGFLALESMVFQAQRPA